MAMMYLLPILALAFDMNYAGVTFPGFLLHAVPVSLAMIILCSIIKTGGWARPVDTKIVSWEAMLFTLARWPWSLLGSVAAIRDWATGTFVDFRVTPKGGDAVGPLPYRVIMPYAYLSVGSAIPVLFFNNVEAARGFYALACLSAAFYALVMVVILVGHLRENGLELNWKPIRTFATQAGLAIVVCAMPVAGATVKGDQGLQALAWGTQSIGITRLTYTVSGAGQGGRNLTKLTWNPDFWSEVWRRD
jgi:hypothetical protein